MKELLEQAIKETEEAEETMAIFKFQDTYLTVEALGKMMREAGVWAGTNWINKFSKKQYYISEVYEATGRMSGVQKVIIEIRSSALIGKPQVTKFMPIDEFLPNYIHAGKDE